MKKEEPTVEEKPKELSPAEIDKMVDEKIHARKLTMMNKKKEKIQRLAQNIA